MVEIVAIDGPASVGKSTLAKKYQIIMTYLLNSGRLYRAVALKIINKKINIKINIRYFSVPNFDE